MNSSERVPLTPTLRQRPRQDCKDSKAPLPSPRMRTSAARRRRAMLRTMVTLRLLPRTSSESLASPPVMIWRTLPKCLAKVRLVCRALSEAISEAEQIKLWAQAYDWTTIYDCTASGIGGRTVGKQSTKLQPGHEEKRMTRSIHVEGARPCAVEGIKA